MAKEIPKKRMLIVGNWKMNKTNEEARGLVSAIIAETDGAHAEVVVCPPFTALSTAHAYIKPTRIILGAQDVNNMEDGAFTGEVSARMLKEAGCVYVILGHSERRQYYLEDNALVNDKIRACFKHGLIPIVCVGESLAEREAELHFRKVESQIDECFDKVPAHVARKIIVAYEPVWAIGTGKNAAPAQVEEMHKEIRKMLEEKYDLQTARHMRILYGGSVNHQNAKEILAMHNVDGALVGGASLSAIDFGKIVKSCK